MTKQKDPKEFSSDKILQSYQEQNEINWSRNPEDDLPEDEIGEDDWSGDYWERFD